MADERQRLSAADENSESGWTGERLAKFWQAMVGIYGQRWIREWGSTVDPVWERELRSMTPDEAAMGWQACKTSGDREPCTLAQFTRRVKHELISRERPEVFKALSRPSRVVPDMFKQALERAEAASAAVDVARLAKALGTSERAIVASWPRRVVTRGTSHPSGWLGMAGLQKRQARAKQAGRSLYDLELELMAYHGWTPDDEERYQELQRGAGQRVEQHDGDTPFLDAWRESSES